MAYPDFTTSHAPDFVSNILRIPRDFNDMANANARTQIAQQQQATNQWIAQIQAAKAKLEAEKTALDIKNDPDVQRRANELADSETAKRTQEIKHGDATLELELAQRRFANMMNEANAYTATNKLKDQANQVDLNAAITQANGGQGLTDAEITGDKGDALRDEYAGKFKDPNSAKAAWQQVEQSPRYANAFQRQTWTQPEVDAYERGLAEGVSPDQAHSAVLNGPVAERKAKEEAQKQVIINNALIKNNPTTLTAPEDRLLQLYLPPVTRQMTTAQVAQREAMTAPITNEIIAARTKGGKIDEEKIKAIRDAATAPPMQSQLDNAYKALNP